MSFVLTSAAVIPYVTCMSHSVVCWLPARGKYDLAQSLHQRRNEGLPMMQRGHYYSKSEFAKTSSEKLLTFILIFSLTILYFSSLISATVLIVYQIHLFLFCTVFILHFSDVNCRLY